MRSSAELLRDRENAATAGDAKGPENCGHLQVRLSVGEACDLYGEECVTLARTMFLSPKRPGPRQLLFCGVDHMNGSSAVCASVGQILAGITGKSVCLVDANAKLPKLSEAFGIDRVKPSLRSVVPIREECVHVDGQLWLAGSDIMAESRGTLLPLNELKHRMNQLESAFDYLLVDAPGVIASRDAVVCGSIVGTAVLVIEANKTRKKSALKAKEILESGGVPILGTILRDRCFPIPEILYKHL